MEPIQGRKPCSAPEVVGNARRAHWKWRQGLVRKSSMENDWTYACRRKNGWWWGEHKSYLQGGKEVEDSRSLVSRKLSVYQLLCHHNFVQPYCWLRSLWSQFIEWYYLFTIWAISLWCISLEEYCSSMSLMNCAPELSYLIGYQCLLLTYKTLQFHCMRVFMCVCASVCVC